MTFMELLLHLSRYI